MYGVCPRSINCDMQPQMIIFVCLLNVVEDFIIEQVRLADGIGTGQALYLVIKTAQTIVPYLHQVAGLFVIRTQIIISSCREAATGKDNQGK